MTSEEFVLAIKIITKSALSGLLKAIIFPPGRTPAPDLVRISNFYNKLSEDDKIIFYEALALAAEQSACNFLSVIDGTLAIESTEQNGQLELYYNDGKSRTKLNDTDNIMLNDIFRREHNL